MSVLLKKISLLIVALIVFASMVSLGFWQLGRAQQKLVIKEQMEDRQNQQIDLNASTSEDLLQFNLAVAQGRYMVDHTVLLDSQVNEGQVGYHVLTPFALDDSEAVILVNRGWVAAGQSRQQKPSVSTPAESLRVTGRLNKPPSKPMLWNDSAPLVQDGAWQYMDLVRFRQQTGLPVLPLWLELDKTLDGAGGYVRQWRAYDDNWVSRHRGYAVQWFAMALAFLIMCVYVSRKSRA